MKPLRFWILPVLLILMILTGGIHVEAAQTKGFEQTDRITEGESVSSSFSSFYAEHADVLLFSFEVKGERACTELDILIEFSGGKTLMTYYAPVQWTRIYMPVVSKGIFQRVTITPKDGDLLLGDATVENKKDTTFEALSLESGMWMVDAYEDVVLDAREGLQAANRNFYRDNGIDKANCVDLVGSSCGNYLYSIGGGKLTVTDISDPDAPRVCSVYDNPEYPNGYGSTRQMCLIPGGGETGDAVIFTSRISGVFIVDVSDPDNPKELSHYDSVEMATGLAVYGNYAFVANRQYGVEIVDLSDLTAPRHLGLVSRGGEVQSCKVVNGILYCGLYNTNQVTMYDVKDVLAPVYLGAANLNGRGDGMSVAILEGKTYLYAATGHHSVTGLTKGTLDNLYYGQGNGLEIFDVTDPTAPVRLSVSKTDGRFCHSRCDYWGTEVSVEDGRVYVYLVSTYNGVYVYDATDPAAPVRLAHITARTLPGQEFYAHPDFSHTSTVYPVIFQYDPEEYKQAPMGAVYAGDGVLYMAGVYTDIHSFQADWAKRLYENPQEVTVDTQVDYYANSRANVRLGGQVYSIAAHNQKLYVAAGSQGILVYSMNLQEQYAQIPVGDIAYDLWIQDGLLYSAEGRSGAAVYRISQDGLSLQEEKRYFSSADLVTTIRPSATGRFIALHVGPTTGEIVDISGLPSRVAHCSTATQAYHHYLEVIGSGRYVVFWGLNGNEVWYDFGPEDSYDTPQKLHDFTVRSRAAWTGGYTALRGESVLMTGNNGYTFYEPARITTKEQLGAMAQFTYYRPTESRESTKEMSISGRGYIAGDYLITCDRGYGKIYIMDVCDLIRPVMLQAITDIPGCPDIATAVGDILYIPMGYEGIKMVDLYEFRQGYDTWYGKLRQAVIAGLDTLNK